MPDRLTVKGLGAADGDYEFDLASLVSIDGSEALNLREQQRVKILSGYRPLEMREAVSVLDPAMMVALVDVLVTRAGNELNTTRVWDAKMIYTNGDEKANLDAHRIAVNFHIDSETEKTEAATQEGGSGDPEA